MVRENIDIVVREHGARVVRRNIEMIGEAALPAARAIRVLQNALFVIGGAGIIASLQRVVDSLTQYENRLKLTSDSMAQVEAIQRRLFETANRSRTAFDAVTEIYSRTALSVKNLGISQKETIRFTESLSKATILSGASAREARAALVQLAQGMASNRLSGDELRSVLEQLPFVADVIARSLNVTRGELREMGADGKISAEIVLKAFREAREEIDTRFANTVATISQAVTILGNKFAELVDRLDDFTSGSSHVANLITLIANSLDELATAIIFVSSVFATKFLVNVASRLNTVIAANQKFKADVASGNVILLNSVEIENARAASISRTAAATKASTATRVADLVAESAMLNITAANLALEKERLAFTVEGSRARLVATGTFVNLASAEANLARVTAEHATVQARALATEQALTATRTANISATNALAAAQTRAAAASVAAGGAMARLARAAPGVAALAASFGSIVTFLGGPWVVAIGLVLAGLFLIESRSQRIDRINRELEDSVIDIKDAYDKAGLSAANLRKEIEGITLVQALEDVNTTAEDLADQLNVVGGLIGSLSQQNVGQELRVEFLKLSQSIRTGEEDLGSVLRKLDEVGRENESLRPLIKRIQDSIQVAGNLEDTLARLEATARIVGGTSQDLAADLALLGIGSGSAADNLSALEASFKSLSEVQDKLGEFVPELEEANKVREGMVEINALYEQGLKDLQTQEKNGAITTLEAISAYANLESVVRKSRDELTGVAEAQRKAAESLQEYTSETTLRQMDERGAALEREKRAYEEVLEIQREARVSQADLNALQEAYQARLALVNEEFDERLRKEKELAASKFSFEDFIAQLEEEIALLQLSNDSREVRSRILQAQSQIGRQLTEEELRSAGALAVLAQRAKEADEAKQEQLSNEKRMLEDLQGPNAQLIRDLETLERLFDRGAVSISVYTGELHRLETAADVAGQALRSLQMNIPDLAKMIKEQDAISQARRDLRVGTEDLEAQFAEGNISPLDRIGGIQNLQKVYRESIKEIDGTAESIRKADKAFEDYSERSNFQGMEARARAIAQERKEFEKLAEILTETGQTDKLAEAEKQLESRIANINKNFDIREAKKKSRKRKPFTFEEGLANIEKEIDLLKLSNDQRRIQEGILKIEGRLRRDLTTAENEAATEALVRLDNARRADKAQADLLQNEIDLLNEIHGPRLALIETQQTLNRLYDEGRVTLEEYLKKMNELEEKTLALDETMSGGFKQSLNDAIMSSREFGEALGSVAVSAVDKLTDAILEFAETGKFAFKDFIRSVISDLFKLAMQQILLQILGAIVGVPMTGAGGGSPFANAFRGGGSAGLPGASQGGSIMPSGAGNQDTQIVAFKKRPDERVDILTPQQQRSRDDGGRENNRNPEDRFKIVNVIDDSVFERYLQTSAGERLILNVVERNRG